MVNEFSMTAFQDITQAPTDWWFYQTLSSELSVKTLDDRHNPKMLRIWFREFLLEHIPSRIERLVVPSGVFRKAVYRARAALLPFREWKYKTLWQSL
jgi:hypothetical protein